MRDAFLVVGVLCVIGGGLLRQRNGLTKGFSIALVVVGAAMIAAALLGGAANWW